DVAGERWGPRRFWPRAGDPEHPLGSWPTVCRRDRRSVRHRARAVRRRRVVRNRPHPDGLFDLARDARPHRRRFYRLRALRLFLLRRARGVRQAVARELAFGCVRRGRCRRFIRPVLLFPGRGIDDGRLRLADHAGCRRRGHVAGAAALACAHDGAGGDGRVGGACVTIVSPALSEAVGNRSYVLLVLGFFTCGFQLAFITVHMPAYLIDRGLSAQVGGWTIAAIGLFNIVGSLASGWLGSFMPKRYILSFIYFARAAAVLAFISFPVTAVSALLFGAVLGLPLRSTVAPPTGLIAVLFRTRLLGTPAHVGFV